jgi:hypothetical protein
VPNQIKGKNNSEKKVKATHCAEPPLYKPASQPWESDKQNVDATVVLLSAGNITPTDSTVSVISGERERKGTAF